MANEKPDEKPDEKSDEKSDEKPAEGSVKSSESNASRPAESPQIDSNNTAYWRANLKLGGILLLIWFTVSFGFGILLVEPLNQIPFFGFKLGFWWAQQGSIFVFVVLIFVYTALMKRIDKRFDVHDDED